MVKFLTLAALCSEKLQTQKVELDILTARQHRLLPWQLFLIKEPFSHMQLTQLYYDFSPEVHVHVQLSQITNKPVFNSRVQSRHFSQCMNSGASWPPSCPFQAVS